MTTCVVHTTPVVIHQADLEGVSMSKAPRISEAEWEVMNILWEKSPLFAGEVIEKLQGQTDWNHRTIRTLLARLVKKGVIAFEQEGKAYLYRPMVSKRTCVREESKSFSERIFRGDTTPLLASLVEDAKLSPEDIEELRRILDKKAE